MKMYQIVKGTFGARLSIAMAHKTFLSRSRFRHRSRRGEGFLCWLLN